MGLQKVGTISDLKDSEALIVDIGKKSIGIYKHEGEYFAYENICPHQGGPVCEGDLRANVESKVSPDGRRLGEYDSTEKFNITCPWHGYEYDIKTGVCRSDKRFRLRSFEVVVEGKDLNVRI